MYGFGSLFIIIISSSVILHQFTDARRIPNDAIRDEFHRQFRRSFEEVDGRRMKRDIECPAPYHVLTPNNQCVWSCAGGTTPDNNSNECICEPGLIVTTYDQLGRRICTTCPAPYHGLTPSNQCVWSCSTGTTPDPNGLECICQAGLVETGTDQFGRRVCTACPAPYHVLTPNNLCVWSCAEGTTPDNNSNECICQVGFVETGTDQFGRRVCTIPCPAPYHVLTPDNRCVWSCSEGTTPDNNSNECICQVGLVETGTDQLGRRVCTACPAPYHVLTPDNRCVWSCSEGTTPDNNSNECICKRGLVETGKDQLGRRICTACPGPYHVLTPDNRCVWSCGDGTTPDNKSNECVCKRGLYDIGHDSLGRRVCGACKGPHHIFTSDKRCVWNCRRGTVPDPFGTECISVTDKGESI